MAKVRKSPAKPHDGHALFSRAVSAAGLAAGWERVLANRGAAGGDRVTCEAFERGAAARLGELRDRLLAGAYRPGPVRRVEIPKDSGGVRRLTIPCVADRVAQSSVGLVLSPLLEGEFEDVSYGYRPGRSVKQALAEVQRLRKEGFVHTFDADIEAYFDNVPHDRLMDRLLVSVSESPLSELVALWLETSSEAGRGLAQGSPLSPLLANLYLDHLDEEVVSAGMRIVRYADDFLVLARDASGAQKAKEMVGATLAGLGLRLHPEKTRLRDYDQAVRFLGASFVRSFVLAGGDDAPALSDTERLLADIARRDREAEEALEVKRKGASAEREAGYTRAIRVLHVADKGRRLGLRNLAFAVFEEIKGSESGDKPRLLAAIHPTQIDRIEIGPRALVETEALRNALSFGVELAFVNGHGETLGALAGPLPQRATRHIAQARHHLDPVLRLDLAQRFVAGRIRNQRALVRRINQRRGDDAAAMAATGLSRVLRVVARVGSLDRLLGAEGMATQRYWRAFSALLLHGWSLPARKRRPAPDPVNAALNLAASLLERDVRTALVGRGLHPGIGFLHAPRDGGDSLVFDMMEIFRAPLAEGAVLEAFNTKALRREHCAEFESGRRLGTTGQRAIIRAYEQRAESLVASSNGDGRVSWRRILFEQAGALARHLEGGPPFEPFSIDY